MNGALFLIDLGFRTPSVRGPGLRDTSPLSSSNNKSSLLSTKVENFRQEQKYEKFFAILIKGGHDVLDTLVLNNFYKRSVNLLFRDIYDISVCPHSS